MCKICAQISGWTFFLTANIKTHRSDFPKASKLPHSNPYTDTAEGQAGIWSAINLVRVQTRLLALSTSVCAGSGGGGDVKKAFFSIHLPVP